MELDLEPRWRLLWQRLGAAAPPPGWYEQLVTAWQQPQRHYHTLEHLRECLTLFDELHTLAVQPADVELAIWFHDAVYEPGDEHNELRSAYLAEKALAAAGCAREDSGTIRQMILATRHHGRPETADEALLLDIDLAIFAATTARYDRYEDDIRREYHRVPWPTYVGGRRKLLRSFHDRPRIYHTDYLHERLDASARANLSRALRRLPAARALTG